MNRSEFITIRSIPGDTYRLDYHSAEYQAISRIDFVYTLFTVTSSQENRPDLVALKVYGDSKYWFPLYQFNGIIDAIEETIPGLQLKIPDFGRVDSYLKAISTVSETGNVVIL